MVEFKGTKGEWIFKQEGHWCEIQIAEPLKSICAININVEEHIANAKLITCAPEMLEMLKESITVISWYMDNCDCDDKESFFNIGMNQREQLENLILKATQ